MAVSRCSRYILRVSVLQPKFIRPCRPIGAAEPPTGSAWLHEPKLDGYRLQVVKSGRDIRLYNKGGSDWTKKRLTALAFSLAGIPARSVVIDAELVYPDAKGLPNFAGLRAAMNGRQHELAVFALHMLHRDGIDLCPLPLAQRKHLLATVVQRSKVNCLNLVATFPDGQKLLASAERMEIEGIVSKRRAAPYRSGECRDWRKVKTAAWA